MTISSFGIVFSLAILIAGCTNSGQNQMLNVQDNPIIHPDSLTAADSISLVFNYSKNNRKFELTFLEFGSVGCSECKRMEEVMDSVRDVYGNEVQVLFYHVRNNRKMTKFFNIDLIPVQILLDRTGRECYRHVGYLPFYQLEKEIIKYGKL